MITPAHIYALIIGIGFVIFGQAFLWAQKNPPEDKSTNSDNKS